MTWMPQSIDGHTENPQDQRLATADETTAADGIASPLHPLVPQELTMKLISRRTRAAGAAKAWLSQYPNDRDGIAKRIDALGPNPDPDAVNKLIGNDTWTRCDCDECSQEVEFVIQVGQEPDYESSTAMLCGECVRRAMAIVLGQEAK